MKPLLILAALAVSVPLSGCVTSSLIKDLSPEQKAALANKFIDNCAGTVAISGGGASGQMGGAVHGDFAINGTCGKTTSAPAQTAQ